jgi:predicted 2-oxoglutarate/Fe(II)-dependent dioxygenase YbiX
MWSNIPTISPSVVIFSKNKKIDSYSPMRFTGSIKQKCERGTKTTTCELYIRDNIYNDTNNDKLKFEKFVKEVTFNQSTVGLGYTNKIDDTIRKSMETTSCLDTDNEYINELFKQPEFINMFPSYYHAFMIVPEYSFYGKLLKYDIGDFFARHTDGKASDNHFQTILILPPKEMNQFEGGELIFYTDEGEIVITHDMLENWLFIIFRTTVPHECKPVTKGTRYSFAYKYEMDYSVVSLFKGYQDPIPLEIKRNDTIKLLQKKEDNENELQIIDNEIEELENKLSELKTKKSSIENNLYELNMESSIMFNSSIDNLIDINQLNDKGIIILCKYYDSIKSPEELIGRHRIIYNYLVEKYKIVQISNLSRSAKFGEEVYENTTILDDYDEETFDWNFESSLVDKYKTNPLKIIYEKTQYHGSNAYKFFEYNDSTYDMKASNSVTTIYFGDKK